MSPTAPSGGFSLFPNTNTSRPPSRNQTPRPRAPTPQAAAQDQPSSAVERTPPRTGRRQSVRRAESVRDGKQSVPNGRQPPVNGQMSPIAGREDPMLDRPAPVALADVPPRCETAFSEAQTLVRSSSNRSRSSIAKPSIFAEPPPGIPSSSSAAEPALRSIFPTYNPNVPLDRQEYYPTQTSPTHIPRSAISRPLYSPNHGELRTPGPALRSPMSTTSPMSAGTTGRWPPRAAEPPVIPPTSTADETRGLWKVTNGWKASSSEGHVYCLRMTAEKDAPIYTLSSATQPFYDFRLDPTSTSAYVTVSRHDPHKPYKGPPQTSSNTSVSNGRGESKHWQEVLTTTLEEESRRLPPNDGLVALLYPSAAARMALEQPNNPTNVMLAENECGRLVWDADSGNHFLVHPALAMPFCVTVERNAAWSRTEYTLEHIESPQHLARLTRDGTGNGWLELDTSIAAKIDAVYLADVAVAALLLVAHKDDRFARVEVFEPPPSLVTAGGASGAGAADGPGKRGSGSVRSSWRDSRREERAKKKRAGGGGGSKRGRMEEFEIDIESQNSEMGKPDPKDKEKLPGAARGLIKILTVVFKCLIWFISIGFKALAAIVAGLAKCVGVK